MSATIILTPDGRLEAVVLGRDDVLHVVQDEKDAVLFYDQDRDPVVRGYGRVGLTTYEAPITVASGLISVKCTTPTQPEAP